MEHEGPTTRLFASWRSKSYDVLPALSIRGKELRSSLHAVTLGWVFGSMWMIGIGGATISNFAKLTDWGDFHWGVYQAIGFLAMLAQLPASYIVEATGLRKITFLGVTTIHRLMWMFVGLGPLMMMLFPGHVGPGAVISATFILIFLSSVLGNMGSPAWVTWMSDLIPTRIRGRYFARRNTICLVVQMVATLSLGWLLDYVIVGGKTITIANQPALVWTLVGIFALAGLAGAMDITMFRRIREVVRPRPPKRPSMRQILTQPLRNRQFLRYVSACATMTFGMAVSGMFFLTLCQNTFRLNSTTTNLILVVFGLFGGLASSGLFGRLTDRWGRRPVMIVCMIGTVFGAWLWLLVPDNRPSFLDGPFWNFLREWAPLLVPGEPPAVLTVAVAAMVVFFGGVVGTGLGISQFNMLLGFSNEGGRSAYVAASSIISSLAGVIGGLLGGYLAESTKGFVWHVGPFLFVNYHIVFLVSGAIRATSIIGLIGMSDPGAKPTRMMLRAMLNNLATQILWPARLVSGRLP